VTLLLDTHVVLWWLADDPNLSDDLKQKLDHEPDVYVSPASLWEVGIKQAIGKLKAPDDLPEHIIRSGFRELPVTFEHAVAAGRLPPIHRDPFDRMLVAQARCADLTLVTRDADIQKYDVPVLLA
jgi:PIN domain nuclease of toxin-antitoxin system